MTIANNISDSRGISDEIRHAILQLEPEFQGDWEATVIAPQEYTHWELKLENARRVICRDKIERENQNPRGVQACMRKLRGEIDAYTSSAKNATER